MRRTMTRIFKYHTRYTVNQIAQIASPNYPARPGLIAGLPNHVSVLGPNYEQYDFCGVDEDNLVLVRLDEDEEQLPKVKAHYGFRGRIVVDMCPYCGRAHHHNPGGFDDDLRRLTDCFQGEYVLDFSVEPSNAEQPEGGAADC